MQKITFIHRNNNLQKNRGLHNLKSFFEEKGLIINDIDMGRIKSFHFVKQLTHLIFKTSADQSDLFIIRDPIFVTVLKWFRTDILKKTLFLSREMYEHQMPLSHWKLFVRYFFYKNAHKIALKHSPNILFSNDLRRDYYINKIGGDLNERSSVFESHYYDEKDKKFPVSNDFKRKLNAIKEKYKHVVCYAGSLQPGRDIDLFIRSFDMIEKNNKDTVLVVAGFDRGNYENILKSKRNIIFLGALNFSEVHALYKASDWGIMHYDNNLLNTAYCAPLKLYEYLHFNLGLISNKNIAMEQKVDLITHYYNDENDLAEALNSLSEKQKKKINKNDIDYGYNFQKSIDTFGFKLLQPNTKRNIFYITRTYPPQNNRGGALMREAAVNELRKNGYSVTVITPNYNGNHYIHYPGNRILIPIKSSKNINRFRLILEYLGLREDSLDNWTNKTIKYLTKHNVIKSNDIIIATSGGDLASFKVGIELKTISQCFTILNYRDPITGTYMFNEKYHKRSFFKHRDKIEKKYITKADLIITSNHAIKDNLEKKYKVNAPIIVNYFGYIPADKKQKTRKKREQINFVYGGTLMRNRQPEILIKAYQKMKYKDKAEVTIIGNLSSYPVINTYKDMDGVILHESMKHDEYLDYMNRFADVGFLSLANGWYCYCLPSKFYEYINLGLPTLASIHKDNEARKIIDNNRYGLACDFADIDALSKLMDEFVQNKEMYNEFVTSVTKDKKSWAMNNKITELIKIIKEHTE